MIGVFKKILGRSYYPLNKIEVSKDNLILNYNFLSKINKNLKIAPVLKSNAYGHGITIIGKLLDDVDAPFFCVDSLYEAFLLKKAKIKTPILIMGYVDPRSLKTKKLLFSFALWDLELAGAINKYQKDVRVHIFVDTGMHREGVLLEDLENFIKNLKEFKNLKIEGLMSHLASAPDIKNPQNKNQINLFEEALKICKNNNLNLKYKHISASAGLLTSDNKNCNIGRAGKAFYGIDPIGTFPKLKPVLKFISKIVQIKKIKKGGKIGYDGKYTVKDNLTLGILPLGYNDGLDRRLSNKGVVQVQGIDCPIVGMISMNLTAIDLSNVKESRVGDEVLVYSDYPNDKNSIQNTAKICQTTPYDILVNLVESTRREIV